MQAFLSVTSLSLAPSITSRATLGFCMSRDLMARRIFILTAASFSPSDASTRIAAILGSVEASFGRQSAPSDLTVESVSSKAHAIKSHPTAPPRSVINLRSFADLLLRSTSSSFMRGSMCWQPASTHSLDTALRTLNARSLSFLESLLSSSSRFNSEEEGKIGANLSRVSHARFDTSWSGSSNLTTS